MAEFCLGSAKIVGIDMIQLHPLCAPSNNVPNEILGDPFTQGFPWRLTVRKIRPAATFADDTALVDAFDRRSQPERKPW
jgi:hypothetical protein